MVCDDRMRIMGEGCSAFYEWRARTDKLKLELKSEGTELINAIAKIHAENPYPLNPYKEGTMRYEFWYTGFRNASMA